MKEQINGTVLKNENESKIIVMSHESRTIKIG